MTLKRYTLGLSTGDHPMAYMEKSEDGEWVKYEDVCIVIYKCDACGHLWSMNKIETEELVDD